MGLGDGQTNSIRDTLAQGTGGDLNTSSVVGLRVTGSDAVDFLYFLYEPITFLISRSQNKIHKDDKYTYPELLQIVEGNVISKEVEESILEHASVAVAIGERRC